MRSMQDAFFEIRFQTSVAYSHLPVKDFFKRQTRNSNRVHSLTISKVIQQMASLTAWGRWKKPT